MTSGGTGGSGGKAEEPPLYAIGSVVYSPDFSNRTSYIHITPSLDPSIVIDKSKSIEASGEVALYGVDKKHEFFVAGTETGALTKYTVDKDSKVNASGEISFAAYGVNTLQGPLVAFVSDTKAYLWDDTTQQAFVWNPSAMTIGSHVDLSAKFHATVNGKTYRIWRERASFHVGNKIYTAFFYWDTAAFNGLKDSGMIVINTDTDEFTVVPQPNCSGLWNSMLGPDGMIYSATSALAGAAYAAGSTTVSAPCMVRFDPKTDKWDDTYFVDLTKIGNGNTVAGLVENTGTTAFVRMLNKSLLPAGAPMTSAGLFYVSKIWDTYTIDVEKPTMLTKVDTPTSASAIQAARTDGHTYIPNMDYKAAQSILLDTGTNPPTEKLKVPGYAGAVILLR